MSNSRRRGYTATRWLGACWHQTVGTSRKPGCLKHCVSVHISIQVHYGYAYTSVPSWTKILKTLVHSMKNCIYDWQFCYILVFMTAPTINLWTCQKSYPLIHQSCQPDTVSTKLLFIVDFGINLCSISYLHYPTSQWICHWQCLHATASKVSK